MNDYLLKQEWKIIENQYRGEFNKISENIFSIGNGQIGQRANFEESFNGETIQENYISGVYFSDAPKGDWWKSGDPEYLPHVPNFCDWNAIRIILDQEEVNLAKSEIKYFYRELDMKRGLLTRKVEFTTPKGRHLAIESQRFCSMADQEIAAIEYKVKSLNYRGGLAIVSHLDFDIKNNDPRSGEKFWKEDKQTANDEGMFVTAKADISNILCAVSMNYNLRINGEKSNLHNDYGSAEKYVEVFIGGEIAPDSEWIFEKYINICSSLNHPNADLQTHTIMKSKMAKEKGFQALLKEHTEAWAAIWANNDRIIKDDVKAQHEARFNIFQTQQMPKD